jgi:glycosyltransferase involved in cell wall biosynthesis
MSESINKAIKHIKFQNHILFLANPFSTGIIGKTNEKMIVFDAFDNLLKHAYLGNVKNEIRKSYDLLKKSADIIFANSEPLTSYMSNGKPNAFCIRNGVDLELFRDYSKSSAPEDIQSINPPIIGYAGKINKRLDIELLKFVIEKLPQINFVFIGQMMDAKWFKPLLQFSNVHYLGDKHYSQLPAYLSSFDICSIPHCVGVNEHDGDLIKIYEYLASGRPVVSTDVVGVDSFKEVISMAATKDDFLDGLQKYLQMGYDGRNKLSKPLRNSIPASWTWESRAKSMIKRIGEYLDKK